MSFKSAFLKALGFSSADDDEYDEMENLPSALPVNQQVTRDSAASVVPVDVMADHRRLENAPADENDTKNVEFEFPLDVFDGLLKVFNDAQPDFIQKCLDTEAQRKYLYESMNASFKEYMSGCMSRMQDMADRRNENILRKFDAESADMRRQLETLRKNLAEAREQGMSAVRQRRAFNEKIRDLEQQIETEKAEKDQYALETKSLLNKLKVAQVQGASDAESAEEIMRLRASVDELKSRLVKAEGEKQNLERAIAEKQQALETAIADLEEARSTVRPAIVSFIEPEAKSVDAEPEKAADGDTRQKNQRRNKKSRRVQKPPHASISVIDDTLDTTEWLVPTPPAGSARPASSVSDAEFGYHEPQRDDPPANDAQLSLFD